MTSKAPKGNRRASRPAKKRAKPAVDTKGIKARQAARLFKQKQLEDFIQIDLVVRILRDEVEAVRRALSEAGLSPVYPESEEEE